MANIEQHKFMKINLALDNEFIFTMNSNTQLDVLDTSFAPL